MSEAAQQELIVIPKESALQVFTTPGSIEPYLEQIKAAVSGIVPDLTTKKGRDAVASLAYKVTKSKTYIEGVGKQLADEQKEIPKKIDATRRQAREFLEALAADVRKPLTEWEAEQARIEREAQERAARIQAEIEAIMPSEAHLLSATADVLREAIKHLSGLEFDEQTFGERLSEACELRKQALGKMLAALEARERYDAEQAELARLRAEKEERDRQDRERQIAEQAAEQARQQEQQRQQAEREASERQLREAEEAAQRAEQERQQAEQRAAQAERDAQARAEQAAEAERQRIAEEQRLEQEAAAAREADREHKKNINTAAMQAFIECGMKPDDAKLAVTLIAQRRIPAVSITY